MATAAQQRANEQNAKHSTGPRTAEGKKRSSLNALKHGFCAEDPLIRGENPDDFYRHGAELEFSIAPATPLEEDLVEQIIDITWRLKRFKRIESCIINDLYDDTAEQHSHQEKGQNEVLGKAMSRQGSLDSLSRISRYEANLRRAYHGVLKELRTLRKARRHTAFFRGLDTGLDVKPQAQPRAEPRVKPDGDADRAAATASEAGMTEPTQSVLTLLESIAPMKNPNGEPDPSDMPIAEALRFYAETPEQAATQEAAR